MVEILCYVMFVRSRSLLHIWCSRTSLLRGAHHFMRSIFCGVVLVRVSSLHMVWSSVSFAVRISSRAYSSARVVAETFSFVVLVLVSARTLFSTSLAHALSSAYVAVERLVCVVCISSCAQSFACGVVELFCVDIVKVFAHALSSAHVAIERLLWCPFCLVHISSRAFSSV